MNILALDPATFTGWATLRNNKVKFGSEKFHDPAWDGNGMRYIKYAAWLRTFEKPDLIVYEAVMAHTSLYASHVYGAYLSEIQKFGHDIGSPYTGLHVQSIKKFWLGDQKGKRDKKAMVKMAWKKGYRVKDDNQADALAILHLAQSMYIDEWA